MHSVLHGVPWQQFAYSRACALEKSALAGFLLPLELSTTYSIAEVRPRAALAARFRLIKLICVD